MSATHQSLGRALERIVGQSAVAAEWQHVLGADWPWARHLLRATDERAGCFPKLENNPASPAAYRIVWRDEASDLYVGACPDKTGSIELRGADLQVYELDRRALAERIASAMGLVVDFALLEEPPHTCRIGAYSRLGMNEAWVYLGIPPGPRELSAALASLAVRHHGPFLFITPTRSSWRGGLETLRRDCAVVALDEVVELHDAGRFTATPRLAKLFERLCPQPPEDAPRSVFRRRGKARLLVYEDQMEIVTETKGCRYIAFLLANPGVPQHVSEVLAGGTNSAELARLARHGGEAVLDGAGWADLKGKSKDLLQELADARRRGDKAAEERAHAELADIAAQADRARGMGGRDRKIGSTSERARKAVWIAIDRALKQIKPVHEPLWRHLHTSIVRGTFLLYSPPVPISWQL